MYSNTDSGHPVSYLIALLSIHLNARLLPQAECFLDLCLPALIK